MVISNYLTVVRCDEDGCRVAQAVEAKSKKEAIEEIRAMGWSAPYPHHYCPAHRPAGPLKSWEDRV